MKSKPHNFHNWIPVRVFRQAEETLIDWCFMGDIRFTHPFFDVTVSHQLKHPFNLLFRRQTTLESLGELSGTQAGVQPTGFIFHLSRCGSTLVSQMLSACPENIVISEAPPLDFIIRALKDDAGISRDRHTNYLKWMINAFGQKRFEAEKYLFVKFDSWHALDLELINQAFPDVPWIFLYRNPVEIIVSQMRQGGLQMIPGRIENLLPDLNLNDILQVPVEEYCGRILGRICQSVLENINIGKALLVNYNELPCIVFSKVFDHFGITYRDEAINQMQIATRFNAKTPQLFFEPDVQRKKQAADERIHSAAGKFVMPFYQRLETIRLERAA